MGGVTDWSTRTVVSPSALKMVTGVFLARPAPGL